jgi:hypothetical protein
VALADAWDDCCRANVAPADEGRRRACLAAVARRACLRRLEGIPAGLRRDQRDRAWAAAFDEALLADCPDALRFQEENQEVQKRLGLWREWEEATRDGDALRLLRLAREPLLADYPPVRLGLAEQRPLLTAAEKAERLLRALGGTDDEAVRAALDLSCVAGPLGRLFRPHRDRLLGVIGAALAASGPRAADPPYELDAQAGQLTLRWAGWGWPLFGLPDRQCRVSLHPDKFLRTPDDDPEGTYRPGQRACRAGGYQVPLPSSGRRVFVTVWAVVPVDPDTFGRREVVGPPLHLAEVPLGAAGWWRSLWGGR